MKKTQILTPRVMEILQRLGNEEVKNMIWQTHPELVKDDEINEYNLLANLSPEALYQHMKQLDSPA